LALGKIAMSILVLGSINMDLVVRASRFPSGGETLIGSDFHTTPGGKGANQAVACAKLGAPTRMVGCVGNDDFGKALLHSLAQYGVNTESVLVSDEASSGVALITLNTTGENTIIVAPGTNNIVGEACIGAVQEHLEPGALLLLQLEVPIATVIASARIARAIGATVILDPAPAQLIPDELYGLVDVITPNQHECSLLVGSPVNTVEEATAAAKVLLSRGVGHAIVKLGGQGLVYAFKDIVEVYPAYAVPVVDTVGAGDAFNGGLASALQQGQGMSVALRTARAAGALSVTKQGAQVAMPTKAELDGFLASH